MASLCPSRYQIRLLEDRARVAGELRLRRLGICVRILRLVCVWQRSQTRPWNWAAIALTSPPSSSNPTRFTDLDHQGIDHQKRVALLTQVLFFAGRNQWIEPLTLRRDRRL